MKAGLFAGGAAHGAYWVGYHYKARPKYDAYIGTSTGALIALFLALGRIDPKFYEYILHEYQNTTNREMYGWFQPFKKNGKVNRAKMVMAGVNMIRKNDNHFYDITKALEKKIRKYFKPEHFDQLKANDIEVIVTAKNVDLINSGTFYASNLSGQMDYTRFLKFVVASAAIPYYSNPVMINGYRWVDGGVLDPAPTGVIGRFDEVDIYLCYSEVGKVPLYRKADSWGSLAVNLVNEMRHEIQREDIDDVTNANVYYIPRLNWNSANFDKALMRQAVNMGYDRFDRGL